MRVRFSRELAGAAPAMIIPSSFAGKENLGNLAAFPRPRITSDCKSPHNDGLGIILELPSKNFGVRCLPGSVRKSAMASGCLLAVQYKTESAG
jgi:hypothetical protein